jgi:hypothetical protein
MYRTRTGQTGYAAYVYELAAIENARRALDARMSTLVDTITAELPAEFASVESIATDKYPDATLPVDRECAIKMMDMCRLADTFGIESVRSIITNSNLSRD